MATREWVVRHLGEKAARAIERFAAALFGDDQFVECPNCKTPVVANLVSEWGHRPVCRKSSDKLTTDALLARREMAMEASKRANNEVAEIDQLLSRKR